MTEAFWDDLTANAEDPEFVREYIIASVRVSTIDTIVNALDEARTSAGLSKAELARRIGAEPATVRRLFSATAVNPTLGTLAEVAAALGLRLRVEPLPEHDVAALTSALRTAQPTPATIEHALPARRVGRSAA
jgi:transcriptional regulator with XRE-family HTH domain